MNAISKLMWTGLLLIGVWLIWRRYKVQRYGEPIILQKVEVEKDQPLDGVVSFLVTYVYEGQVYTQRSVEVGSSLFSNTKTLYDQKGKRTKDGKISCDGISSTEVMGLVFIFMGIGGLFDLTGIRIGM